MDLFATPDVLFCACYFKLAPIDNSMDEAVAGHASRIEVEYETSVNALSDDLVVEVARNKTLYSSSKRPWAPRP